jgi:hypothetical protein
MFDDATRFDKETISRIQWDFITRIGSMCNGVDVLAIERAVDRFDEWAESRIKGAFTKAVGSTREAEEVLTIEGIVDARKDLTDNLVREDIESHCFVCSIGCMKFN